MTQTLAGRLFRLLHRRKMDALSGIPGPSPQFPFGNALDFLGRLPWEVCAAYGRDHGGMAVAWILGTPVVILNDPALIARVLGEGAADYYKDAPRKALEPVVTRRCLFVANGEDWSYRRSVHPARGEAAGEWLASSAVPAIRDSVASGVRRLAESARPGDLYGGLERVAFDAFASAVFGEELGDEDYRRWVALGRVGARRMTSPLQFAPPLCPMFYLDRRRWYARFDALIEKARRDPDPTRGDLLARTIRGGTATPPDDFRVLLANVFYGGVYSATSCLATALYLLAEHPEAEARLRGGLAGLDLAATGLGPADLDACPGLAGTILEALRFLTPVPLMARNVVTTRDVELGGHSIPANTTLFLTIAAIYRSPDHWPEPDRFDPGRWDSGETDPIGSPHFFPFGQGPRTCVGMPFALTYLKTALATILSNFRVEFDRSGPYQATYFSGVMIPRGLSARFVPARS
jgi:cytochrome P450